MLNNSRKAEDGDGKQRLSSAAVLYTPVVCKIENAAFAL